MQNLKANSGSATPIHQMRFIDLFSGCGGLSLGLMNAGWQGIFAIEKNADAFLTLQSNLCDTHPSSFKWPKWLPREAMTTSDLLTEYGDELKAMRGSVELIAGGPPCQGFSFAGRRNPDDPRNRLNEEYIKVVNIVRPKYLLFENVRGFAAAFRQGKPEPHSAIIKRKLENLSWGGYTVFCDIINASIFGVPQPRPRFILIAVRTDYLQSSNMQLDPFSELNSFCSEFRTKRNLLKEYVTVKDAISDLEVAKRDTTPSVNFSKFERIDYKQPNKMTPFQTLMRVGSNKKQVPNSLRLARHRQKTIERFKDILDTCPKGVSLSKSLREKYGTKKQCFTPLHPDQLSKTITTLPDDLLHYSEPRILTVRENARIQTFPDWFQFLGKYTTGGNRRKLECPRYTQVGNAVPPLMAEALGELLRRVDERYG